MKKIKKANCHLPKYDFSGLVGMSANMLSGNGKGSVADDGDLYEKIKDGFKKAMPFAGLAGSAIYTAANPSDDYSNEKSSTLGMGLQGAAMGSKFGGIYGAIGGGLLGAGIGWYGAKKRNIEREEADNNLYNAYILNSTVDPTKMKEGGTIHINPKNEGKFTKYANSKGMSIQEAAHWVMANSSDPKLRKRAQFAINATKFHHPKKMEEGGETEDTGTYISMPVKDKNNLVIPQMYGSIGDPSKGIPITHIQTEKGEKIGYPDGSIFDIKAKEKHEKMDKDEVTDILPQGSYIFGARDKQAIKKKTAEKISMGNTPIVYNEFDNSPQTNAEEIKLSDLFKKEEHTPAELAEIVKKKFKLSSKSSDAFTDVTNDENKVGRIPYLMNIMKLTEEKKGNKIAEDVPNEMKKGGMVKTKKYDIGGLVGLMSQYLPPYKVNLPDGQTSLPTDAPPDNSIDSIYSKYGQDMKNFSDKYQQKYADYFKYARGANAAANAMGILGTVGQSSYVNPGLLSNRYANQMFQKVPNFVRDANKTESLAPIYAIGRNQGVLGIPTSTTMSRLAPMVGNAVNSVNQTNKQFALDDVSKDNARYKFMQDIDNKNLTNIANAQNRSIGMDNYKMSQVAGFGGRALTGDATLAGKELGTNMGLEKQAIDAGFNSAAQMAAYKIQQQMMDKLYGKNAQNL